MENVPRQHREVWGKAMARVLCRIVGADNSIEMDRALKWFLILIQALFRQARRGGRRGKGRCPGVSICSSIVTGEAF